MRDEFNLNVLAGALYGPWLGTLLCALLTGLACSVTFALVAAIRALTRPLLADTVWSRKIALYNELVDISSELEAVSERLAVTVNSSSAGNISAEYRELKLRTEALKRHHLETVLRGLRLQQTEFASGDMQECSLVERYLFGTAEEEVNEVFLDVLVDRAFQSASLASLLYATVQYPPMVTSVASAIGYLPYAFYGVSKGARLMTSVSGGSDQQQQQQQSLYLFEDQAPRFRFHLGVFFFLLWLTPFLLQMATLKREQYRNNVLINRWHLRNVRRALGEMDEEVEEIAPVPADEAVVDGPLDDIDDEDEDGHGEQQEQLNELDNLEIDPDFLLL